VADFYIGTSDFSDLVERIIKDSKVAAPIEASGKLHLLEIFPDNIPEIRLSGFRTVESFKSYFFKLTERVSKYFNKDEIPQPEKLTIIGARSCDLEGLEILDRIFTEDDFKDPFYIANREKVTIISSDCTDCGNTCFCSLVKGNPYPLKFFDLNLSPIKTGFIVEIGTEKGKKLVDENRDLFLKPTQDALDQKKRNREKIMDLLMEKNKKFQFKLDFSEIHKMNLENKVWRTLTKDCVECSACNFICPTCSCFLLLDQEKNNKSERYKVWDACLKAGYARVAGGANPRAKLYQRLQNRYHCKFDYSFDRLDRYTCVGCGRCIDGCAGKIDMRDIFMELEKQVPLTAKLK